MVLVAPSVPERSTRTAVGVLDETVYGLQEVDSGKLMTQHGFTYVWFREDLAKRALGRYNRNWRQPRYRIVKLALVELER